ncbi:MAG: two-component system, sporulation sensor kinase [Blastocatellia bacterium]|jgi:PAS domain S-box-containing protein|nr:two-component system, sporulation sensor kinase [Blastocatellia bacterium]
MSTPGKTDQRPRNEEEANALASSLKELADIKFALDQSTIVAITDQRGIINYVNDQFCRISKYSREELLGQDHRIINSRYHREEFIRNLWTTIAAGQVWKGEIRNRAKDGTVYWVDTTIVPFLDADGKPYQYVAVRHDITQRKLAEEQVLKQAAELQRAAQLSFVGELAAGLAHEIKNPLAGIQGVVDILIRRRDKNDPEREALEGVRHEVQRIDRTVRALLDRARPRLVSVRATSLMEIVARAVNLARAQSTNDGVTGRGVELEFTPPSSPIIIPVDPAQIEDAVLNLIINAIEATNGDGQVNIRVAESNDDRAAEFSGEALVEISDNGRGIGEEDLERIFNPFFTTRPGGTGLGLPAVRRIARAHGGRVIVKSTPGNGSTFTLYLPLNPQQ